MQEKTPRGGEGMLPSAPCADAQRVMVDVSNLYESYKSVTTSDSPASERSSTPPPLLFITNQSLPFSAKSESTEGSSNIVVLLKTAQPLLPPPLLRRLIRSAMVQTAV